MRNANHAATLPMGPHVWVLERCDGTLYGYWTSRHDAVAAVATECNGGGLNANHPDWFTPVRMRAGEVPLASVREVRA